VGLICASKRNEAAHREISPVIDPDGAASSRIKRERSRANDATSIMIGSTPEKPNVPCCPNGAECRHVGRTRLAPGSTAGPTYAVAHAFRWVAISKLNVGLDAETFVRNFRQAVALLGNEPPPSRRPMKVIDADDADHH